MIEDVPHVRGNEAAFTGTRLSVSVALANVGLTWNDVEDTVPLPDWDAIFCRKSRPTSWNLRFSYHAPVSHQKLKAAVVESLTYHPTLRSVGVEDDHGQILLVSVRNTEQWARISMTCGHVVEAQEELNLRAHYGHVSEQRNGTRALMPAGRAGAVPKRGKVSAA